jgi:hypothetical protein
MAASPTFDGKLFCFTGTLLQLKRTQAERETRARGGLTVNDVNDRLDFLVVGSKASPGWKYGKYGTKIATAREIAPRNDGRPQLVSEPDFMDALASIAPSGAGAIDAKVLVCNYSFIAAETGFDAELLDAQLESLRVECGCHVHVTPYPWRTYRELFGAGDDDNRERPPDAILVQCRVVRQMPLDESSAELVDRITRGFESVPDVDGKLQWFERTEGTAGYVRLLAEIPQRLRVSA